MKFAQPYWLLAGLAACLFLLWRYRAFNQQQRAALTQFVSPRLVAKLTATVSGSRRRVKQGLFILGVACLFVALARPQAGFRWEEVHRRGIQLLVAVDTSKSMLTPDVKPNRLERAKLAVDDLVDKLDGDSVGLMAFAGQAFLQCPFTLDYDAFRDSVNDLNTDVISRGGTDIGGAIREAQAVLNTRPDKEKVLVLLTDGEDLGGDAVAAAQAAGKDGITIFTVGVGTPAGGLIPVPDANGGTQFLQDPSGQFVKSRLDEATLRQIAAATKGMYEPLGQEGQGLTAIYDQGLSRFMRHELASRRTKVPLEQFQWPLLAALLCFASELLIGTRKRTARRVSAREMEPAVDAAVATANWRRARATTAMAFALFALPAVSHASPSGAETAYEQGRFLQAEKEYAATLAKEPKQPKLEFNLGSAAYKSGDYAQAATAFQNTLHTTDVPVQENAYYNLGDTQYRTGQAIEQSNPQDTIKIWERAVQSYSAALQIKPDDADARFNRDLVARKLEQLKKQMQQQEKQNQSSQGQSKQGQNRQNQKQTGQNDQQQNQQNQQPAGADQGKQPQQLQPAPAQSGQPQSPKPESRKGNGSQSPPPQIGQSAPDQPGEMSKDEANQLLDSLKSSEHKLPAAQVARGQVQPPDNQPYKDW
ncbi:MAG TPA: VWA domain-containing protein [Candidatus Acidoferrales bacterium]|nr:VWA domain-containing protein [Candidatus Acidoferrales bacterium]